MFATIGALRFCHDREASTARPFVRSAPFADAPSYFGGQFPVLEKQLDERTDDFLPGDAGEPQAVGRVSLPDVQGPVGGRGQIDGPSGALAA